jgi:hypothetical protein
VNTVRARLTITATLVLLALGVSACGGSDENTAGPATEPGATTGAESFGWKPEGIDAENLDQDDFVDRIDNEYMPLLPGSKWVYEEKDADGTVLRVTVDVLERKKTVQGVEATVVRDVVREDGEIVEDTVDWFAQDKQGNVWYLGEFVKNYEGGKVVDNAGSWEAGVGGAVAGVIMPANPEVGLKYQQEFYEGEAEDRGEILALDEQATVPFGSFKNMLKIEDTTPLEPKVREHKYYAKGIGVVLVVDVAGGGGREALLRFEKGT